MEERQNLDTGDTDQDGEKEVRMDRVLQLFSIFTPVLLALAAGVMLIVEWRGMQTEQIRQLKEADQAIRSFLLLQIQESKLALSSRIEETNKHIVLNRKYMEKNRENINDCSTSVAKFEGVLNSHSFFGVPEHSNRILHRFSGEKR